MTEQIAVIEKKNVVKVVFSQHLDYDTKGRGGKEGRNIKYDNDWAVVNETVRELSAENIASWLIGQLGHFMAMMRLQGKTGFKLSKPIRVEVYVNNKKAETFEWKFSMNLDRVETLLNKQPELVARAFTKYNNVADSTVETAMKYLTDGRAGRTIIAPAKKKAELNPSVAEDLPLIEETA